MERDLARHVIRTAFRTARELSGLLAMLKQYLDEEEYKAYARRIATAIYTIDVELIDPLYASQPGLKDEVEASLDKYERFL
jgi:hypothetical protein